MRGRTPVWIAVLALAALPACPASAQEPRERKEEAIAALDGAQADFPSFASRLGKVIRRIERSLFVPRGRCDEQCGEDGDDEHEHGPCVEPIFLGPTFLDPSWGRRTFREEGKAVHEAQEILKKRNVPAALRTLLEGVIASMVAADRDLARVAVEEATAFLGSQASSNRDLQRAIEDLARGDASAAANEPREAIGHYGEAWEHATEAGVPEEAVDLARGTRRLIRRTCEDLEHLPRRGRGRDRALAALAERVARDADRLLADYEAGIARTAQALGLTEEAVQARDEEILRRFCEGRGLDALLEDLIAALTDAAQGASPQAQEAVEEAVEALERLKAQVCPGEPADVSAALGVTRLSCEVRAGVPFRVEVTAFRDDFTIATRAEGSVRLFSLTETNPASSLFGTGLVAPFQDGRATIEGTLVTAGEQTLRAELVGAAAILAERSCTVLPGAPATISLAAANPRQEAGRFLADLTAGVEDAFGNGAFGADVVFQSSSGEVQDEADQGDGTYAAVLSTTDEGPVTVTAQVDALMAATQVSFAGPLDATSPVVVSFSPEDGATLVPETAQVVVTFSEPIDPASAVNAGTFFLTRNGSASPVGGALAVAGPVLTFTPEAPLAFEAMHHVLLTAGIEDLAGNPLAVDAGATASFTVKPEIFPPDTEPPFIVSTTPADGATSVGVDTPISVTYNEPLRSGGFRFIQTPLGFIQPASEGTTVFSPDRRTITYIPEHNLPPGIIRVAMSFPTDRSLNTRFFFDSYQFTTEAADGVGPHVVEVEPADGAAGVPRHSAVRVRFNEPVEPGTVGAGDIRLERGGMPVAASVSFQLHDREVLIEPASLLDPSTAYTVVIEDGFTDEAGNPFDQIPGGGVDAFASTFTTGAADVTGLRVESVTPGDGEVGVSVLADVVLGFDEEIDPASVTASTVLVSTAEGPVAGVLEVSEDARIVTFAPSADLARDTRHEILVDGVQDLSGNPLDQIPGGPTDPFQSTFRTTHADRVGPRVAATFPASQAQDVPVETRIDLTFSEPVTLSRFPRVFQGGEVPGTWTLSPDRRALSFLPDANFGAGGFVSVSISFGSFAQDIRDDAGNPFDQEPATPGSDTFHLFFSAVPADTVAPFVVASLPADAEGDVPVCTDVVLDFSEPVDPSSVGPGSFLLEEVGGAPVPGTVDLQAFNRRLVFTPDAFLENLTDYRVAFGAGVTDAAGNPLQSFASAFATGPVDLVGPIVTAVEPAAGAVDVSETSVVRLTFSERLDPASVTAATVRVSRGGSPLSGTLTLEGRDMRVVFSPDADLPLGGSVDVIVSGVRDGVGNLLDQDPFGDTGPPGPEPFGASFAVTQTDHVSPRIVSSTPAADARVDPAEVIAPASPFEIVAIASEPVLPQTVNPRTVFLHAFRFLDFHGGFLPGETNRVPFVVDIPGDLSVDPDGRTIRFRPDPLEMEEVAALLLDTGMAFTFEVTPGVTDLAGNPLNQDGPGALEGFAARIYVQHPFRVVSVLPEDGADRVGTTESVFLTFNDSVDGSTLDAATFAVSTAAGPAPGTYFGFGRTAIFSPQFPGLAPRVLHEVSAPAGGIRSLGGEPLSQGFASAFTTDFTDVYHVVRVSPANGATGVGLMQPVEVEFAEELDIDRLTALFQEDGGFLSVGNFSGVFEPVGTHTVRFTPDPGYFPGIEVPVRVYNIGSFFSSFHTVGRTDPFVSPEFVGAPDAAPVTVPYTLRNLPPLPSGSTYEVTGISGVSSFTQTTYTLPAGAPSGQRIVSVAVRTAAGLTPFADLPFEAIDAEFQADPVVLQVRGTAVIQMDVDPPSFAGRVQLGSSPDIFRGFTILSPAGRRGIVGNVAGSGQVTASVAYGGGATLDTATLYVADVTPRDIGRHNFSPREVEVTIAPVSPVSSILAAPAGVTVVSQANAGGILTATLRIDPAAPLGSQALTLSFENGVTHDFAFNLFGAEVAPAASGPGGASPSNVVRFSDLSPTARFLTPGDGAVALVSQSPPTVRLEGFVSDPIADVTPGGVADIRTVRVGGRRHPLIPDPSQVPTAERPYAFRGLFTVEVPLSLGINVLSSEATNILGKVGIDEITIVVADADGNPATPGLSARAVNHQGSETGPQNPVFLSYRNAALSGDEAFVRLGSFQEFTLSRSGGAGPFTGGPFLVGNVHHQISIPGSFIFGEEPTPIVVPEGVPVALAELGSLRVEPSTGDPFFFAQDDARVRIPGVEVRPVERSGGGLLAGHFREPNLGDNLTTGSFVRIVAAPAAPTGAATLDVDLESRDSAGTPIPDVGGEARFFQTLSLEKEGDVYATPQDAPIALVRHATARAAGRPQHRVAGGGVLRATIPGEEDEARTWDTLQRNARATGTEPFVSFQEVPQEAVRGTTPADGGMGSVWLHSGEFHHAMTDVSIPGVGFPFELTRTYRSQISYEGMFGVGWDCNLDMRVLDVSRFFFSAAGSGGLSQSLLLYDGSGRVDRFTYDPRSGTYIPPAGWYVSIQRTGNSTYVLTDRHGTEYTLQQPAVPFRSYAYLKTVQDRNGNTLTVHRDGEGRIARVTDTLDRDIRFEYGHATERHLVTAVEDFSGRRWEYEYGAFNELLKWRRPPTDEFPMGTVWTYAYTFGKDPATRDPFNHNLTKIVDPKGQTFLVNQYDGEDRVAEQRYGTAAQVYRFGYDVTTTRVTDRRGNVVDWSFPVQPFGGQILPVPDRKEELTRGVRSAALFGASDPASYTTQFAHNGQQELSEIVFPELNRTSFAYDEASPDPRRRGNLLEMRRVAGPRGDGRGGSAADIVTTWTYDPLFNFVRTTTDPRGNVPGATEALRASFTTRNVFDYEELPVGQGGIDPVDLGDFNADGVIGAPAGGLLAGNVIGVIHPPVPTYLEGTPDMTAMEQPVERFAYNHRGQRVFAKDPLGNRDVFVYYEATAIDPMTGEGAVRGYLAQSIRAAGVLNLSTSFTYNLVGNVRTVTDPNGRTSTMEVNALNLVTKRTSPSVTHTAEDGTVRHRTYSTFFAHDANDNVTEIGTENVGADGLLDPSFPLIRQKMEYDILNTLRFRREEVSPGVFLEPTEFKYDESENQTLVIQPEGNRVLTGYDERDLVLSVTQGAGSAEEATTRVRYDGNGGAVETRDALLRPTFMTYDGFDRSVDTRDAEGNRSIQAYDPAGNAVRAERRGPAEEGGPETRLSEALTAYDAMGRVLQTDALWFDPVTQASLGADGVVTSRTFYDLDSHVRRTVDDNGHGTDYFYDAADRRALTEDVLGNTVQTVYDPNSNVPEVIEREISQVDMTVEEFRTLAEFDEIDRAVQMIDPLGHARRTGYDSRGNARYTKDALGNFTRNLVDGLSRQVERQLPLTQTGEGGSPVIRTIRIKQEWDGNSRLAAQIDDNGNPTVTRYDALDRPEATVTADGLCSQSGYSPTGAVLTTEDSNGTVVVNGYDLVDRLTNRTVQRARGVLGTTQESYGYDGLHRMVRAQNDDYIVQMRYDSLGRQIRESIEVRRNGRVYEVRTTTDGVGNRKRIRYPDEREIVQECTALDQLERIEDAGGVLASYAYAGPSRVERRTARNGVVLDVEYDAGRRVLDLAHTRGGSLVAHFRYGYNDEDQRLFEQRLHEGGRGDHYFYDSIYRLTAANLDMPDPVNNLGTPAHTQAWVLDGVGNRLNETIDGSTRVYTPNNLNQYTDIDGVVQFHDGNGNLTQSTEGLRPQYDFKNRMVRAATSGGAVVEQRFDPLGRRIEYVVDGTPTLFLYDGQRVVEEHDAANQIIAQHVWGNGIDELIQTSSPLGTFYFHEQGVGSVTAATDAFGGVVERYGYEPFGATSFAGPMGETRSGSAIGNRYLFTGRELDAHDVYYYRTRQYKPKEGRFAQRDRLLTIAHEEQAQIGSGHRSRHLGRAHRLEVLASYKAGTLLRGRLSTYEYANSSPLSFVDPLGLDAYIFLGDITGASNVRVERAIDDITVRWGRRGWPVQVVRGALSSPTGFAERAIDPATDAIAYIGHSVPGGLVFEGEGQVLSASTLRTTLARKRRMAERRGEESGYGFGLLKEAILLGCWTGRIEEGERAPLLEYLVKDPATQGLAPWHTLSVSPDIGPDLAEIGDSLRSGRPLDEIDVGWALFGRWSAKIFKNDPD